MKAIMKKKFKIVLLVVAIGISSLLGTMASTLGVTAANNECDTGYTSDTYINNISYTISGNDVTFSGVASSLTYTLSYDSSATQQQVDSSGTFTITVPDDYSDSRLTIYFTLPESDGVCESGKEIGSITFYLDGTGINQLYDNELCVNYRNKWSNNSTMKAAVPYCFTEYVSVQYSYNDVSSWITEAESLYNIQQTGSTVEADPDYTNVDDVTNTDTLVCDAFSTSNYDTVYKYSHKETETSNNCTTTCVEQIEVNFSDPVATQAGLCFQYLIEIKSTVECDSVYTAPKPSKPAVCVPTAYCVTSNGYESEKGGPSEDFDECVLECDGGEYTQSCIDTCYTEVYESDDDEEEVVQTQKIFDSFSGYILTLNSIRTDGAELAVQLANGCIAETSSLTSSDAEALYNQKQKYPGGYYSGTKWVSSGTCPSSIGYFYFRSLSATRQTISELNGTYSDSYGEKQYKANSDGFLIRFKRNGYSDSCDDTCSWINNCSSDTVLTEYLAEQQYQEELAEWESGKAACEAKAATCTNETTDYTIVVDNIDNDGDSTDDEETFSSSQKLNGTTVTGDFIDMVILTDGLCEDGEDDPWHYHNIITFPGVWINNKTGQTVHTMDSDLEDFYTYAGNSYCTKLDSVPINTAWYDWKVNQNGDSSALTDSQKSEIEATIEMNIKGYIENYGYFGWDFDIECFYAVGEPDTSCTPTDPEWPTCDDPPADCDESDPNYPYCDSDSGDDDTIVDDYQYRSISLDNLFPNSTTQTSSEDKDIQASNLIYEVESLRNNTVTQMADTTRQIGFNWTCGATNLENPDYIIQPVTLINQIQELGSDVYSDEYLDYHIVLTPETMEKIRDYNDQYDSYAQPTTDSSNEVLTAGASKTAGVTVYRSYLLHKVLDSSELLRSGLIGCNNEDNGTCNNTIDTSTACYNEYIAESTVLKGAD